MASASWDAPIMATASLAAVAAAATGSESSSHATSIFEAPHTAPTVVNLAAPYVLFIIQISLIIVVSRLLSLGLGRLRQPRVISDILAGIVLGPTALGRIPNFSATIFPTSSLPFIALVANLGLIFFLFLVGLEVDVTIIRRNARAAGYIATAGLVLPFGLSWAVTVGLYDRFVDPATKFSTFGLFVAVAFSITAFPVLARILTELRLLSDQVGVTVLAAGVANDVVGWVLLALSVALAGAGAGVEAVYVLLCALAWTLILFIVIRPLLIRIIRRSGGFSTGPTQATMALIIVLTLVSADITSIIGVHAIFGAFLVGVIVPHERGFAKQLTERMEDFVTCALVPLYFTLSGLSTDLGLLNTGEAWAWAICIITVAFVSKFLPCALAGRAAGFDWRESFAVGSLMSCKGLVELIVLNIGLQAGILNQRVFAMFVLEALTLTCASTPLTLFFYPQSHREKRALERAAAGQNVGSPVIGQNGDKAESFLRQRFALVFSELEHLPSAMAFVKLCQLPFDYTHSSRATTTATALQTDDDGTDDSLLEKAPAKVQAETITLDALRLVELTQRTSAVMLASEIDEAKRNDVLTSVFTNFCAFNGFRLDPRYSVVAHDQFAPSVVDFAVERGTDMVIVPWSARVDKPAESDGPAMPDPFTRVFGRSDPGVVGIERSPQHAAFVRQVCSNATCDVAIFIDASIGADTPATMSSGRQHLFFAFEGGPDDRAALNLVVQLCHHPGITASVICITRAAEPTAADLSMEPTKSSSCPSLPPPALPALTIGGGGTLAQDTVYAGVDEVRSQTMDEIALAQFFPSDSARPTVSATWSPRLCSALSRIAFADVATASPLRTTLARARADAPRTDDSPLLFIAGRGRRGATSHTAELDAMLRDRVGSAGIASLGAMASSSARAALGDVATAALVSSVAGSFLVVQANSAGGSSGVLPKSKGV